MKVHGSRHCTRMVGVGGQGTGGLSTDHALHHPKHPRATIPNNTHTNSGCGSIPDCLLHMHLCTHQPTQIKGCAYGYTSLHASVCNQRGSENICTQPQAEPNIVADCELMDREAHKNVKTHWVHKNVQACSLHLPMAATQNEAVPQTPVGPWRHTHAAMQ